MLIDLYSNNEPLCSKNAKVSTEVCRSKIHMPCVRGPYSNIKKRNSFSIYRGKILAIFKENSERVSPCPSTWHEDVKAEEKLKNKDPFSVLSKVSLISCLISQRYIYKEWNCYNADSFSSHKTCKIN